MKNTTRIKGGDSQKELRHIPGEFSDLINEPECFACISYQDGKHNLAICNKKEDWYKAIEIDKESFGILESFAKSSSSCSNDSTEIERKFLLGDLPEYMERSKSTQISQGYLVITSAATEIRLREKGGIHLLTIKSGSGKIRKEGEIKISKSAFEMLWPKTEGKRLEKIRHEIPYAYETGDGEKKCLIEMDVYSGAHAGLSVAEVEFSDEKSSEEFIKPEWFSLEVTEDKRFKNQNLALSPKEKLEELREEIRGKIEKVLN